MMQRILSNSLRSAAPLNCSYSSSSAALSRSAWKGPYIHASVFTPPEGNKIPKIMSRNSVIPYSYIDRNVLIHNGKTFIKVLVTRERVGFKFGDFVPTRKMAVHKSADNKSVQKPKGKK